jgi:hypothetical protein
VEVRDSLTLAVAALLALLASCDPARTPPARQPAREMVYEERVAHRADQWEPADAFREPTSFERTVTERLTAGLGRASSDESACVARETAAFFGRYRALPDEILMQWITGFCGAAATPLNTLWLELDAPVAVLNPLGDSEAQWLAYLRPGPTNMRFGIGAHARGGKLVIVLSVALPQVEVHRLGPDANGIVHLEGRTLRDADVLHAVITHGTTGAASCSRDASVELPEFYVTCQMAPGDDQAYVDVLVGSGRMLEGPVAQVLARRPQVRSYRRPRVRLPRRNDPAAALIDGINTLRVQAGLAALRSEPAEMRLMSSLFPAAFRADREQDGQSLNHFYDELHAGRAVAGVIRWSEIYEEIAYAGDASDWLARVLLLPSFRGMLLAPRAESIALMTHHEPGVGFGAAFATYSLFRDSDDTERAKLVYETVERLRTEDGLATALLEPPEELVLAARRVTKGELPPDDALRNALAGINAHSKRTFTGVWFRVPWNADPENVPDPLLEPEKLECAIVATHRKPPDHAWGEQVVFVVYPLSGKPA